MPPHPASPSSVDLTEDAHTLSEPSTDATASDLVGPGRLLGRLYGHIGHGIETRLNSLAERASRRRSRLSGENIEMTPTGSRPHRGSSSTASSSSSSSSSSSTWRASFTFSTVSSDETATNLPGAGRLLGNLYSAGGHLLESRLNRIANEAGRGPDACAARIKSVLLGEPYQDEVLMFLQVTAGAKRKSRLLPHEEILFKECRLLLRYAQYPSRSTHICAMEHITKLAVNDRYLYTLFNALGASKLLTEVRKRELKMNGTDSDWAIQHCRKAIICLSTNEVNSVSHRNLRLITRSSDESLATLVRVLMKFLSDPELSFLALRYIEHILIHRKPFALSLQFDLYTECLSALADLVYSLPHIVEWECVDDIFARAYKNYVSFVVERGCASDHNALLWKKMLAVTLMNAHRFPRSVEYLNASTDIDALLDPEHPKHVLVARDRLSDMAEFPNNVVLSQHILVTATLFPSLVLSIHDSAPRTVGQHSIGYDNLNTLVHTYPHPALNVLWQNLSKGPDVVVSEILRARVVRYVPSGGNLNLQIRAVPNESALHNLCRRLAEFLVNPDPDIVSRALLRIKFVFGLDRYCRRAAFKALLDLLSENSDSALHLALEHHDMIVRAHNLEIDEEGLSKGPFKTEYIFRHTAKDGRSHLRIDQYRSENPCKICLRDGIWDDPPDLATAARLNVVFCCSGQQLMILEVPAGTAFRAAGHLPVLAGINAAGEREYVASVSPGDPANAQGNGRVRSVWTTVVEGAQSVVYEDEEGAVHTTEHFWVLVLRYDTSAETEARTRAVGGIDVTGQCHWRAGKTTLHLLNKEEADRVYARDRGVLDPEPRE